jgi:hypothetical protein
MDDIKQGLIIVVIVAAVFGLFAAEVWWRRGRREGTRAAGWLLLTLVVLLGFAVGSWAIGASYVTALNAVAWLFGYKGL